MSTGAFADYARYYDLFYRDKDYAAESRLIDGWLRNAGVGGGALLDVGCGTGGHARELAALGWTVTGVDRSAAMIEKARQFPSGGATVRYEVGTGADFDLGQRFAAVVSLFHVVSYHADPGELAAMLGNVRRHLADGGIFVFDFWHGPGVLADPPAVRTRTLVDGATRISRRSTPRHDAASRLVEVDYELTIDSGPAGPGQRVTERHRLRYFDRPELAAALAGAGFRVEQTRAGVVEKELDEKSWYGLIVARAT